MLIRNLRKRRYMTLEQLAAKSGVGRSAINRYELGKREPGVYNAIRIARALGVTVEYLVSDEDIKGGIGSGQGQEQQRGKSGDPYHT